MKRLVVMSCVLAVALPVLAQTQKPKEPFTAAVIQHDKGTDFTTFKTYSWIPGHPSLVAAVDKDIVAAIDAQMAAKGLTKAAKGDVLVAYHAVERADVDLSTFDERPAPGTERKMAEIVRIGTLIVDLKNPANNKVIWRVRVEGAVSGVPNAAFLNEVVAKAFALYPTPKAGKK